MEFELCTKEMWTVHKGNVHLFGCCCRVHWSVIMVNAINNTGTVHMVVHAEKQKAMCLVEQLVPKESLPLKTVHLGRENKCESICWKQGQAMHGFRRAAPTTPNKMHFTRAVPPAIFLTNDRPGQSNEQFRKNSEQWMNAHDGFGHTTRACPHMFLYHFVLCSPGQYVCSTLRALHDS